MAKYNVRDLIGHWVKPRSKAGKMCPHACCRNRRVHPENFPLILPRELLRRAPERDLLKQYERHNDNERVRNQIIGEIDRREDAEHRAAARRAGKREQAIARRNAAARNRTTRRLERAELVEHAIASAEKATNGYMVNKAGRARGVTAESLFTGSEARALRYATPELVEHWQTHPRPSAGLMSANPQVVRRARARSDIGRVEAGGSTRRSLRPTGSTPYDIY